MNKDEQKAFIRDLSHDIVENICRDIDKGKTPESWDGVELRWLLHERSSWNVPKSYYKVRRKEYNNTILVNGL